MEYSPVLFQHCLEMGKMGWEVIRAGGEAAGEQGNEEQNVRLFSFFECLLVCLYRVNKADPDGFGDSKTET